MIDSYAKIPIDGLVWFRTTETGNSKINSRYSKYEEPFDDDLP